MSDEELDDGLYSITSSQALYKRSSSSRQSKTGSFAESESTYLSMRSKQPSTYTEITEKPKIPKTYWQVTKWEVDYNNKNYIRSKCNKNRGLHRRIKGRPFNWNVQYDNNFYLKSKVHDPKGLHRRITEVKRKRVPDNDILADSTGWEFDCGPEFQQKEQDVPYIPEGRIVRKGCFRFYGVKRNKSDHDMTEEEEEKDITEELERMKYGTEFYQKDLPLLVDMNTGKISQGGYRFMDVERNRCDTLRQDISKFDVDPEWRKLEEKRDKHFEDIGINQYDSDRDVPATKGKPFRRTILNKTFELRKTSDSLENLRFATRIAFVPGEGEKTIYEGVPDRQPFEMKKRPSVRDAFKAVDRRKYFKTKEGKSEKYSEKERKYSQEEMYREERRYPREEEAKSRWTKRYSRDEGEKSHEAKRYSREEEEKPHMSKRHSREEEEHPQLSRRYSREEEEKPQLARRYSREEEENTQFSKRHSREEEEKAHLAKRYSREEEEKPHLPKRHSRDEGEKPHLPKRHSRDEKEKPRLSKRYSRDDEENSGRSKRYSRDEEEKPSRFYEGEKKFVRDREEKNQMYHDEMDREETSSKKAHDEYVYMIKNLDTNEVMEKMPPHVEHRMKKIREKMSREMERVAKHGDHKDNRLANLGDLEEDLIKHQVHSKDRGQSLVEGFEKYTAKNGSEKWVKREEKFSELHHQDH